MLATLDIELKTETKTDYNICSCMHGLLMQIIDTEYAQELHKNQLNPYSQYLYYDKTKACHIWRISTLNEDAKTKIIHRILENNQKTFHLNKDNVEFSVGNKILGECISYKDITDKFFSEENTVTKQRIRFLTPTTFKSDGDYIIYQEVKNLYPSILGKWDLFCKEISLSDSETLQHLIEYSKILDYNLKSTRFCVDNAKIRSFIGTIDLKMNGPKTLVNINNLLLNYAKYSGLGAKTSLGMGGISFE